MIDAESCPECGADITTMDAQGFADHMHDVHPATWAVFRRVFDSFGPVPEPSEGETTMETAPTAVEIVVQALDALGMSAPISARGSETPAAVWAACLERMRGLSEGRCWACLEMDHRESYAVSLLRELRESETLTPNRIAAIDAVLASAVPEPSEGEK